MEKIKPLALSQLRNPVHYSFMSERIAPFIRQAAPAVQAAFAPVMPEFNEALAHETAWMEWVRKSALTAKIGEADYRLDHALSAIRAQVMASSYSIHQDVVNAAYNVKVMLNRYGYVGKMSYEAEVGSVSAIIAHLGGDLSADASKAGVSGWLPELQRAYKSFNDLFNARNASRAERPEGTFHRVRRRVDLAYYQLSTLASAGSLGADAAAFAAFIALVNVEIDFLSVQHPHRKSDDAKPEEEK